MKNFIIVAVLLTLCACTKKQPDALSTPKNSAKAITPPAPPAVDGHPPQAQQSTLPKGTLEQR
ncbi:MAG TPA: hypothetical protein EYN66_07725, partial [Myxococcales bacterium]|nr:hypothetical protein [Myxococcales bacterium]